MTMKRECQTIEDTKKSLKFRERTDAPPQSSLSKIEGCLEKALMHMEEYFSSSER